MQSLKQIKNRIRSIENTCKVTNAMQMISVTKLNRMDKALYISRPYFLRLESLLNNLLSRADQVSKTFIDKKTASGKIALCVITSDNGLCGSYNNNIIRLAEKFIASRSKESVELVCIGKRGNVYFNKHGLKVVNSYVGLNGKYSQKVTDEVTDYLIKLFLFNQVDEVYVGYTYFKTALIHQPRIDKFLNLQPVKPEKQPINFILEPDINIILKELIPRYIAMKMRLVFMNAFTSEHASRTVAMKTATENAQEMISGLVTLRNKVRQANITQEIMEIIASSEALKG